MALEALFMSSLLQGLMRQGQTIMWIAIITGNTILTGFVHNQMQIGRQSFACLRQNKSDQVVVHPLITWASAIFPHRIQTRRRLRRKSRGSKRELSMTRRRSLTQQSEDYVQNSQFVPLLLSEGPYRYCKIVTVAGLLLNLYE